MLLPVDILIINTHSLHNSFIKAGFRMDVLGMRKGPHRAIDRVNM